MYQMIAENAVKGAIEHARKTPGSRHGAIDVAIGVVVDCRDADLAAAQKGDSGRVSHIYNWSDKCISKLRNIL